MRAGQLKSQITIQAKTTSVDEYGEPLPGVWTDVATVWADIKHISGMETLRSGVELSVVRASIRIRYRTGLSAGMRAVHGARVYDIRAALPDEASREYVDLVCEIGANQG